jgi:hypothetical protein
MGMQRIGLYFQDQKVAQAQNANVTFMTGSEQIDGQEAVIAATQGNLKVNISFDVAILMGMPGATGSMFDALLAQEEITISLSIGGRLAKVPCMFTQAEFSSENANGRVTGKYAAHNSAQPKLAA